MTLLNQNYQNCADLLDQMAGAGYDSSDRVDPADFKRALAAHGNFSSSQAINRSKLPEAVKQARQSTEAFKQFMTNTESTREAEILVRQQQFINDTVIRTTIHPGYANQLEAILHNQLDISLGQAGRVGQTLQQMAQYAKGSLDTVAMLSVARAASEFTDTVRRIVTDNRLSNDQKLIISITAPEYAGYATLTATTASAQTAIQAKFDAYDTMLRDFGLSQVEIDELNAAARAMNYAFEEPLTQARALGVKLGDTAEYSIPYFPRRFNKGGAQAMATISSEPVVPLTSVQSPLGTPADAERGFFTYTVNDPVAFAVVTQLAPADHLFVRGDRAKTVDIQLEPYVMGNNTLTDSAKVPLEHKSAFLHRNPDVKDVANLFPGSAVQKIGDLHTKVKEALTKKFLTGNNSLHSQLSFNDTTDVEFLKFLGVDAVIISETEIMFAKPLPAGNGQVGKVVLTPQEVTDFRNSTSRSSRVLDTRVTTPSGAPSANRRDMMDRYKAILKTRLHNRLDSTSPNALKTKLQKFMELEGLSGVTLNDRLILRDGVDYTQDFETLATYDWFAGRAEALVDNNNWKSQYITDYDKVATKTNKNGEVVPYNSSKQSAFEALRKEARAATSDTSIKARLDNFNLSEEELASIAREVFYDGLGKEAWLYQNTATGEYVVLPFTDTILDTYVADVVVDLLQNEFATLDFMIGTYNPETQVTTPGKITQAQLSHLVDTGILSRLGMPSLEVYLYTTGKYNLPFHSPADMISTDLPHVVDNYVSMLKDAGANAFVISRTLEDGVNLGWAVDRRNPTPLVDTTGWTHLDEQHLDLLRQLGWSQEQLDNVSNYLFPPEVRELLVKQIAVGTDPVLMGSAARALSSVGQMFKSALLAGSTMIGGLGYLQGNTLVDLVASLGGGGSPYSLVNSIRHTVTALMTRSLDHFSNVPAFIHPDTGAYISVRDAYEMFIKGYASQTASGVTDVASGLAGGTGGLRDAINSVSDNVGFGTRDITSIWRWALGQSVGRRGLAQQTGNVVAAAAETLNRVTRGTLTPAIILTSMVQRGIMFNHFLSLLQPINHNPIWGVAMHIASLGFWNGYATSSFDMWQHMDRTFIYGDKAGITTKKLDRSGFVNFAAYIIKTPINVLRQMANNPIPFYNYLRLLQFSEKLDYEREEVNQLQIAPYELDNSGLLGSYIDRTTGERKGLALYSNWNPYAQTENMFSGTARALGVTNPTMDMYLERAVKTNNELAAEALLQAISGVSSPVSKAILEALTGFSTTTFSPINEGLDAKPTSFLWWQVPGRLKSALSLIPFAGMLDRENPYDFLGRATQRDPWTRKVTDPGEPGVMGNLRTPIRNSDKLKSAPRIAQIADFIGFDFKVISYEANEVNNIRQVDFTLSELEQAFNNINSELTERQFLDVAASEKFDRTYLENAAAIVDEYVALSLLRAQLDAYAFNKGKFPPRVTGDLMSAGMRVYMNDGNAYLRDELNRLAQETNGAYTILFEQMRANGGVND